MAIGLSCTRTVQPVARVHGRLRVPGDKSISHRYAILGALATGRTLIRDFAPGADCATTLACLKALGVGVAVRSDPSLEESREGPLITVEIDGRGLRGLEPPSGILDAHNSGTTMRLLAGVLAAHPFESTLVGDGSLSRRPMGRVIEPLTRMGARILADNQHAPLQIIGGDLHGIAHLPAVASAQVKSAVLLAGLQAQGQTSVREPARTRDHTEHALEAFGAQITRDDASTVAIRGDQSLWATSLEVPGDLSSAAFWVAAAAALPGSALEVVGVGLNTTRAALLDVLRRIGAHVEVSDEQTIAGERRGTLRVAHGELRPTTIAPAEVPGLIDELPLLGAIATHGGAITVTGAAELRAKESDRITSLVAGLRSLGADAEESPDGFQVRGGHRLRGGHVESQGDHRLAMALAIAGLGATAPTLIHGAEAANVSYPTFFEVLESIVA